MTIEDLVLRLSNAMFNEIAYASHQGLTTDELSKAQVLVAKVILADPLNKDNLGIKIDFLGFGREN